MHKWKNKNINLTLDITTHCNAKCPQCSRTDQISGGLKKHQNLPLKHWTIDEVKSVYTKKQLENVKRITFSPTWGDPMMNPDAYEIIDHLLEMLPFRATLTNITNGSMRTEEYWWWLGGLALKHYNKEFVTIFDIDGINQEMHSMYRRNTKLQKVLDNMKAFSSNGKSITRSQSIIFKHNQDYMKEIKELAKSYGSEQNAFVKSDRFKQNKNGDYMPYKFLDENNKEVTLEWADKPWADAHVPLGKNINLSDDIICKWAVNNNLNINFDGLVWPCCYVGAMDYSQQSTKFNQLEIIKDFKANALLYNIKFTPLKDIIKSQWYTKTLQESINNNPIEMCKKQCSTQIRAANQFQLRREIAFE